ncbi:MAG: HD domain-containing protein [Staphylothermus sp.]|nr:HD domain-containing protein [Staphylothermus sp.]
MSSSFNYFTILSNIKEISKQLMDNSFDHGFPHIIRVYKWAYRIIENERLRSYINPFVLDTSIYLHDIGRLIGEPHAYYSAVIAKGLLKEYNVSENIINKVANAILAHSYSYMKKNNIKPESIEAQILSDADKLDALGIVGFIRVFNYSVLHNRPYKDTIKHFYDKIFKLKNYLYFEYSKKVAEELTEKTRKILEDLANELGPEFYVEY